ncbi:hypothetical protein LIPSTDRAFT_196969 [Lipomyces starkeyi NRRL Y-11557]|uniref:Uncharacterized protein n=1 Tax=Lipomyces starkeyi NRRL Y-11557 TaxID=675824 RepID=A0A1E3PV77_LIPST|nr:hypothetical protein LIPSTDRAFT_196969 [Lipomyces starkeyi NRRL Y-11557]
MGSAYLDYSVWHLASGIQHSGGYMYACSYLICNLWLAVYFYFFFQPQYIFAFNSHYNFNRRFIRIARNQGMGSQRVKQFLLVSTYPSQAIMHII